MHKPFIAHLAAVFSIITISGLELRTDTYNLILKCL